MKDRIKKSKLKLTIAQLSDQLKKHRGMYYDKKVKQTTI